MNELQKKLHKENKNRWIGKPDYSCLTCSHSHVTDDDKLMCVAKEKHELVDDNHLCEEWI